MQLYLFVIGTSKKALFINKIIQNNYNYVLLSVNVIPHYIVKPKLTTHGS